MRSGNRWGGMKAPPEDFPGLPLHHTVQPCSAVTFFITLRHSIDRRLGDG